VTVEKLAPGWRIILVRDDWYELQYQEPAMLTWQTMYEGPAIHWCKTAYDRMQEGWSMAEVSGIEEQD
jgi:hypothetical protein